MFMFWTFKWEGSTDALLYTSATLVAILPESASALLTISMAIVARRMARQNVIVRKRVAL